MPHGAPPRLQPPPAAPASVCRDPAPKHGRAPFARSRQNGITSRGCRSAGCSSRMSDTARCARVLVTSSTPTACSLSRAMAHARRSAVEGGPAGSPSAAAACIGVSASLWMTPSELSWSMTPRWTMTKASSFRPQRLAMSVMAAVAWTSDGRRPSTLSCSSGSAHHGTGFGSGMVTSLHGRHAGLPTRLCLSVLECLLVLGQTLRFLLSLKVRLPAREIVVLSGELGLKHPCGGL